MADWTAWRICRENRWWSVFGKKCGRGKKAGPPVHDDLVSRDFTASGPNRLWLADITEHATGDGTLYLCASKNVFSNRIVGYSIDARMKSRLAVTALDNAVARREHVDGCILHSDRGSRRKFVRALDRHRPQRIKNGAHSSVRGGARSLVRRHQVDRESGGGRRQRGYGVPLQPAAEETSSTAGNGPPARNCGSPS
jgi:transposase InsO family protein